MRSADTSVCLPTTSARMPGMKSRRRWLAAAVAMALLAAPACIHLTRAIAFQKATNLAEYEQQMWESVKAAKWIDVRAHMAESYRCTMPNGAHCPAALLEFVRSIK